MKRFWTWIVDHATGRARAYVADPLDRGLDEIDAEQTTQETWLADLAERIGDQPATPADLEPPPEVVDWPEPAVAVVMVPTEAFGVSVALPPAPCDGGLRNRQKTYERGRRCVNPACRVPTTGDVCVNCTVAGYEPPPKVADDVPAWRSPDAPALWRQAVAAADATATWDFTPEDVIAPNFAWDDAAIDRLIAAVYRCETCGAEIDDAGLCADYGRFHASAEHLAALDEVRQHPAFWRGDGDDAA